MPEAIQNAMKIIWTVTKADEKDVDDAMKIISNNLPVELQYREIVQKFDKADVRTAMFRIQSVLLHKNDEKVMEAVGIVLNNLSKDIAVWSPVPTMQSYIDAI